MQLGGKVYKTVILSDYALVNKVTFFLATSPHNLQVPSALIWMIL